jgi:hypothetical protein
MGLFGWFKKNGSSAGSRELADWRKTWSAVASGAADSSALTTLRTRLDAMALSADDKEIELEMLDALEELLRLRADVDQGGLPVVESGHRLVGTDPCHFSAPVSMPDDDAQPSGRLLLTSTKAIFVGGARATTVPWHAVGEAVHNERDLLLIRKDREHLYRFRCNTFGDALRSAFVSQRLAAARQGNAARPSRND